MADRLEIGGVSVRVADARRYVKDYVTTGRYAYPLYDRLDTGSGPNELNDGDLLAATLLNAAPTITGFGSLQSLRSDLEQLLARIDPKADLADSSEAELSVVADIFSVLSGRCPDVGPAVLSKTLHRKRPRFVPIYDSRVWHVYAVAGDAPLQRPSRRRRPWAEFGARFGELVRRDLRAGREAWEELSRQADPPLSPLRTLDIVVWSEGRRLLDEQ